MKRRILLIASALAIFAGTFLAGCDNSSNPAPFYPRPDQQITIAPEQGSVTLTNVLGKMIYMTRVNPNNEIIARADTRRAQIISDTPAATSASVSKSMADASKAIEENLVSGFEFYGENDPHKKIYDLFIKNREAGKGASVSKKLSASAIQASATNYKPGDTETFWALNPNTLSSFDQRTFKLLVSEANYNVWVDVDDKYYTQGTAAFETAAQNLGTNFINGYGLTSHLYGQPSDKIYNNDPENSVYGPMETVSKTGLKINMMLYDMMDQGKVYGFVYHGDVYRQDLTLKEPVVSNEGRFVYIDSQTTLKTPLEANSTAQHEFSHTISRNQKAMIHKKEWTYWYGEFLALTCEDMMQAYFGISDNDVGVAGEGLGNTPKSRLPQANALAFANGLSGEDSLAYASVFQFSAWLTRSFGGAKFIKEVAQNAYVDMESILNAVNAVSETKYTTQSLLQKFSGDLIKAEYGLGFFQNAATYPGSSEYTCAYTDSNGQQQTYLYPLTAINLWDYFYGWCDTTKSKYSVSCMNTAIPFDWLPGANLYKKADWKGNPPAAAYLGPMLFNDGRYVFNLPPYSSAILCLGTATTDTVEIRFGCEGTPKDVITIFAK